MIPPIPRSEPRRLIPTCLGALGVTIAGAGPATIVLWPSIFADHRIFEPIAACLATSHRLILIDGPGHGASSGPDDIYPMALCGAAMLDVMDATGIGRATLAGVSWGGMTAAEAALAAPHRAQAVILINTPMDIDGRNPGLATRLITLGARHALRSAAFRNGIARSFFSDARLRANPDFATHFHDMLRTANARQLAAAVRSVMLHGSPLRERLPGITAPTLVIAGEDDPIYPIAHQRSAARLLPRGAFVAVPGRHISVIEAPDAVAKSISTFLGALHDSEVQPGGAAHTSTATPERGI